MQELAHAPADDGRHRGGAKAAADDGKCGAGGGGDEAGFHCSALVRRAEEDLVDGAYPPAQLVGRPHLDDLLAHDNAYLVKGTEEAVEEERQSKVAGEAK